MPSADTSVPPRARSAQVLRLVLLCALAGPLVGLAAPGSHPAPVASEAVVQQAVLRPSVAAAPVVTAPAPLRRTVRAARTRPAAPAWVRPVAAPVNSRYGRRWGGWHPGVDFAARYGAPIHAVGAGTVIGAGYLSGESGYGKIVLVRHAGGVVTAYAHMSRVLVRAGQRVRTGAVLGKVGTTGHVTGPHLHFEVRIRGAKVSPVPWLRRHGVRV